MSKVTKLIPKEHIYKLDNCAGCNIELNTLDLFYEGQIPKQDNTVVEHIGLCPSCNDEAKSYGIFS